MLILCSNDFKCRAVYDKLKDIINDRNGNALIIPLASDIEYGYSLKQAAGGIFDIEKIFVFDEENAAEFTVKDYRYIIVSGGNTFKLLKGVRDCGLDAFIKKQVKNGADYIGFSAGAYLASPDFEYVKMYDANNYIYDNDFSGLGLTDKYVLCHYDNRSIYDEMRCRQFIGSSELIRIYEEDAVVIDDAEKK